MKTFSGFIEPILYITLLTFSYFFVSIFFDRIEKLKKSVIGAFVKHKGVEIPRYKSKVLTFLQNRYIDKTNIKRYLPFFNLNLLILLETVIVITVFCITVSKMNVTLPPLILSLLLAEVPLICLDFLANKNNEKIKNELASFISVLARWCSVKNDIFYAFEKASESGLREPLNTYVKDLIIQVRCGIHPMDALDCFSKRFDDTEFKDAILNIKQNIKFRGDGSVLLSGMESRLYKIQEESNKRKISTHGDRTLIVFIMFLVLFMAWYFLKTNQKIQSFYLETNPGRIMLLIFLIIFTLGTFMFMSITKFKE